MTNINRNTIEILPNELWLKIFGYFNTYDLFRTFFKLNMRIDSLITNENNLHLILYNNFNYDWCTEIVLNSIKSLSHIKSLTLANSMLIERFHEIYPVYTFTQLQTLRFLSPITLKLFHDILQITTLKSLSLVYNNIPNYETQWKILCYEGRNLASTLNHLVLCINSDEMMDVNVQTTMQSNRSSITILPFYAQMQFLRFGNGTSPRMCTRSFILSNCTKMELDLDKDFTYQQLELVLRTVPQLKSLVVTQTDYAVETAGREWQYLLENVCKHILKFILNIRFIKRYGAFEYPLSYWNQNTFRTFFWLERKTKTRFRDHAYPGFVATFHINL
ncbi:hypothetical protein I4U23_011678 [Adineta vaga]|nr:hypothetical protein I4U23_011678 [Adineta vaga]